MSKTSRVDRATIVRLFKAEKGFIAGVIRMATCAAPATSTLHSPGEDDFVYADEKKLHKDEIRKVARAKNFQELNEKLKKLRGTKDFSLKNKLMKKSLARRIKKNNRKTERRNKNKTIEIERKKVKDDSTIPTENVNLPKVAAKPVFNSQGKMVFSKFDFSEHGIPEDKRKGEKNPKKILDALKKQKETLKELNIAGDKDKASHIIEKTAWKNALAKAEGQKIKDDPTLLKKSAKKIDQKKKQSAKKWEQRIQGVEKTKIDKQKRRETNISKRKQEKKKKILKKAVKKGRILQ